MPPPKPSFPSAAALLSRATLALLLTAGAPALSTSLSAEASGGRGFGTLSLLGDYELVEDRTFLIGGYTLTRLPPIPGVDVGGATTPKVERALTHVGSLGVEHALARRWIIVAQALAGPEARDRIPVNPDSALADRVVLLASHQSFGLSAGVAYDSAGLSNVEWGADLGLGANAYRLGRGVDLPSRLPLMRFEWLGVFRPSLSGHLLWFQRLDLSARFSYSVYAGDPQTAGRFSDAEYQAIANAWAGALRRAGTEIDQRISSMAFAAGRMQQLDAVSGYAAAPTWLEVRLAASYRVSEGVRGRLSYTFARYLPTLGYSNILSTKWSVQATRSLQLWAAVAMQRDQPLDHPREAAADGPGPVSWGLATLGAEYEF